MQPSLEASKNPDETEDADVRFFKRLCLPYLRGTQNADGGWGFSRGSASRTEPTAWALLALNEFSSVSASDEALARGYQFLEHTQLPGGSWVAAAGQEQGCWVTSIACWALLAREGRKSQSLSRGLYYLIKELPANSRFRWRLIRSFTANRRVLAQNDSYYGWSWTHGTASWVEPTAYALIVLRSSSAHLLSGKANRRIQRAEAMLYDRMCPGGGWNCGNPMVYGVAGEAQIGPTVWALLALRHNSERPENKESLEWLEEHWNRVPTLASLSLTHIALDLFGRTNREVEQLLHRCCEKSDTSWNIPGVSWAALAMSGKQHWLKLADLSGAS